MASISRTRSPALVQPTRRAAAAVARPTTSTEDFLREIERANALMRKYVTENYLRSFVTKMYRGRELQEFEFYRELDDEEGEAKITAEIEKEGISLTFRTYAALSKIEGGLPENYRKMSEALEPLTSKRKVYFEEYAKREDKPYFIDNTKKNRKIEKKNRAQDKKEQDEIVKSQKPNWQAIKKKLVEFHVLKDAIIKEQEEIILDLLVNPNMRGKLNPKDYQNLVLDCGLSEAIFKPILNFFSTYYRVRTIWSGYGDDAKILEVFMDDDVQDSFETVLKYTGISLEERLPEKFKELLKSRNQKNSQPQSFDIYRGRSRHSLVVNNTSQRARRTYMGVIGRNRAPVQFQPTYRRRTPTSNTIRGVRLLNDIQNRKSLIGGYDSNEEFWC